MAKVIGGGNISAGVDLAIEAAGAVERFNDKIKDVPTEQLKSLGFAVESLPQMPHHVLGTQSTKQKALDASLLRWLIQMELDRRNAGEISHSWTAMYMAMGIPKEFLMTQDFDRTELLDAFVDEWNNIVAQKAVFDHGAVTVSETVNAHEVRSVSLSPTAALKLYEEMQRRFED